MLFDNYIIIYDFSELFCKIDLVFFLLKSSSVTPAINPQAIDGATAKSSTPMVCIGFTVKYQYMIYSI